MVRPGLSLSALLLLCPAAIAKTSTGVRHTSSSNSTTPVSSTQPTFNDGQYTPWQPATNHGGHTPDPSGGYTPNPSGGSNSGPSDPPLSTPSGKPPTSSLSASKPPPGPSDPTPPSTPSGKPPTSSLSASKPPPGPSDPTPPSTPSGKPPTSNSPPTPVTEKSTTTSSSSETGLDVVTQVTVTKPPALCTASTYKYETKMSLPTGYVLIFAGESGWGNEGYIWEISSGPGSKLVNVSAKAQGGSAASFTANGAKDDGDVKQRKDGSWYMNVTADMQPSLKLSAILLEKDTPPPQDTRKRNAPSKKFPVTVSGGPDCPRPVAGNCTARGFSATTKQWEAFSVDDFMDWYVEKNDITDFQTFRAKAYKDFVEPSEDKGTICDISNPVHACATPSRDSCESLPTKNETAGWIMATAATQFTRFLSSLYHDVDALRGAVNADIHQIVKNNWVNSAKQTKAKILSLSAALMGIIVAACVALTVIFPGASWAGWAVAGAIIAQTAVASAGAAMNMLDPGTSDAQYEKGTEWEKDADEMIRSVRNGILHLHDKKTSGKNITEVMRGGRWIREEVTEVFNKDGWSLKSQKWFEKSIITSFITKALQEEDAYIVFIPYDKDVQYNDKKWAKGAFNKDMCEHHFTGNKNWKYYASCDMKFGEAGDPGMAVMTRPDSKGSESKSWMEEPLSFDNQEIKGSDIMRSAIMGQAEHGFNYTLLDADFVGKMTRDISTASRIFQKTAVDEPGLYPVPVCVVKDLVHVPGIQQVMGDIYNSPGHGGYYHYDAPCPCKDYTADKGTKRKFTDFVSKEVRSSFDDCKIQGGIWAPDDVNTDDLPYVGGGV
ncbi:hypothetical protein N7492_000004 [Penicillium capsulatum]|uniref:Uncharacterized protein n=1 Tax=Penicillium capsulatum TaxID=69766 RepID=A0A9W9IQH0_9EURO|nr:hypothetical protein N7492_000004 [Penicillium capsulatum]KAJ6130923.1 hypothetical protein N7512_003703 [Penicillium capsulatum]